MVKVRIRLFLIQSPPGLRNMGHPFGQVSRLINFILRINPMIAVCPKQVSVICPNEFSMIRDKKCAEDTSGQLPKVENLKNWLKNRNIPMCLSYNRAPGHSHPCIFNQKGATQWDNMLWGNPKSDSSPNSFPDQCPLGNGSTKTDFRRSLSRW